MEFLFDPSIPDVESQAEFEELQKIYPKLDLYYLATACQAHRRAFFNEIFEVFKVHDLLDKDILKEINNGEQGKFHQFSWEMFVAYLLIKQGYVVHRFTKSGKGVDFIVNLNGIPQFYIECTAFGPKADSSSINPPNSYIAQRISSSVSEKIKQYDHSSSISGFIPNLPYIVAINAGDPRIGKSIYGRDFNFLVLESLFKVKTFEDGHTYFRGNDDKKIFPTNVADSETFNGAFLSDKYKQISAVWYSPESVVNQDQEILGFNNIVILNNFAKNQFSLDNLKFLNRMKFEKYINEGDSNSLEFTDLDISKKE